MVLDLEIRPKKVTIYARLVLEQDCGGIEINHIDFEEPLDDPDDNTVVLAESLRAAAFRPFVSAVHVSRRSA
ncbi:MAG: hypothetical protein HoeaKO_27960 [Hoeflea alexandrii]